MTNNFALQAAEQALAEADKAFFTFNAAFDPRTGAMGALESPRGKQLFEKLMKARMHRDDLKKVADAWNRN